jgi:hypothetical protein
MREYRKEIKWFLIIWAVLIVSISGCCVAFTISVIRNNTKLTQAQIEKWDKPTVIEQRYFTSLQKDK